MEKITTKGGKDNDQRWKLATTKSGKNNDQKWKGERPKVERITTKSGIKFNTLGIFHKIAKLSTGYQQFYAHIPSEAIDL